MLDKHSLVSILDGDTIPWIVAYNHREKDDVDAVLADSDKFVQTLLDNTSCTHYIGFLGSGECFRHKIAKIKPYKGQRPDTPDWYKKWGTVIKAHLRDHWKFQVVRDIEADDAVSISATELRGLRINYIIIGADKDLLQIEGNHYNMRTHKREYISSDSACRNLYKQILIGDVADNIEGLKGFGKVRASRLLDGLPVDAVMYIPVKQAFINKHGEQEGRALFKECYQLCFLLIDNHPDYNLKLDYIEVERPDNTMNDILTELFK